MVLYTKCVYSRRDSMGRVSRYKKIKPCDPFYRGPRRDLSRGDNLRPDDEEEQAVPKSLVRLMRRAEQMKSKAKRKKKSTSGSMQSVDSAVKGAGSGRKTGRGRREEAHKEEEEEEEKEGEMFQRRVGESLKDYLERIDVESNARIMESYRTSRKMTDKRKRYLDKRKKRLKGEEIKEEEETEDRKGLKDFTDLRDEVRFGEVVSAPPQLSAKPRGSVKKQKEERSSSLLLKQKLNPVAATVRPSGEKGKQLKPAVGLKRQKDLEVERERAIQLYRENKRAKLVQTGHSHFKL